MLIVGGSGSGKTYALLNLIHGKENDDFTDKIFLYVKDLYKLMYEASLKHLRDPKAFI